MQNVYSLLIIYFLIVFSCKSTFNVEIKEKDKFNTSSLNHLMAYPDMKISNFSIYDYENLKKTPEFQILKEEPDETYFVSFPNFDENINYLKELFVYYRKLYTVVLAYSSVQGAPFKTEIFNYLDSQGIKENFQLRLKFPYSRKLIDATSYVLIKKVYFDMLLEDKTALMTANQKMENIVINFLK